VIPFVDLRLQYESIRKEIDHAVEEVFTNGQFIGGDAVKKFELEFAALFGIDHCIGTGNGTDSLYLILKALGIGPGDEVITPAFSCIPSAECITLTGGTVIFAEVDERYYTLNPADVERKITPKTKAVIAVHLYGQAAAVNELKAICDKHKIFLIEDCAQAHLTKENNQLAGTFGIASAFSFYPTKNLGAYGDAGCVLTQDAQLAEKIRRLANHGAIKKDDHRMEGTNSRLDTLQAAILSAKLKHLQKWNARRIEIAALYSSLLQDVSALATPLVRKNTTHTFHIYAIQTAERDALKKYLAEKEIETIVHYPEALPFTQAYRPKDHKLIEFPISAQLQHKLLSLPVHPGLTNEQVTLIARNIRDYFLG
jgi:dTDP-4-amino-4,6-dideoxygalactose transaminase